MEGSMVGGKLINLEKVKKVEMRIRPNTLWILSKSSFSSFWLSSPCTCFTTTITCLCRCFMNRNNFKLWWQPLAWGERLGGRLQSPHQMCPSHLDAVGLGDVDLKASPSSPYHSCLKGELRAKTFYWAGFCFVLCVVVFLAVVLKTGICSVMKGLRLSLQRFPLRSP